MESRENLSSLDTSAYSALPDPQLPPVQAAESTDSGLAPESVGTLGYMKFTTQPAGAGTGTGFAQQPVITLYNTNGTQSSSNVNVQLKIGSNPTGAVLYGVNVNQQASFGVAKFSDLSIDRAGTYLLTASAPGYGSVNSATLVVAYRTGKTYYVSPTGNDANAGTSSSAPWKTVAKVNSMSFGPGDAVLFKGGQVFSGCLVVGSKIKATAQQPFVIGAYGSGKFQLNANCTKQESTYNILHNTAAVRVGAITGFRLQDCILRGNQAAVAAIQPAPSPAKYGAAYGILFDNGGWASNLTTASVTIQRCDISGFTTPYSKDFGGGIFFNSNGPTKQISILNNVIHGATATSVEDNGIGVVGNAVKSKLSDVVVQGNHVYNIGGRPGALGGTVGSGIMLGGSQILIQNNVAHDTGANTNTCGGPSNIWVVSASYATLQYNEVYHSRPKDVTIASGGPNAGGCDWDGFDFDIDVTHSVAQYNYSHDNWGAGFLGFVSGTWGPNTIRYNISVGDGSGKKGFGSLTIADWSNAAGTLHVYNNMFDSDPGGYAFLSGGKAIAGFVANNVFRAGVSGSNSLFANTNGSVPTGLKFSNNAYWSKLTVATDSFFNWGAGYHGVAAWKSGTQQDPTAKDIVAPATPKMTLPTSTLTCSVSAITAARDGQALVSCLGNGYQLATGSSLIGTGLDLRKAPYVLNIGVRDFFGNPLGSVTTGTHFDIGVD
jgi:hypothetical protein